MTLLAMLEFGTEVYVFASMGINLSCEDVDFDSFDVDPIPEFAATETLNSLL